MFGKKCNCRKWKNLAVVLGLFALCIMTLMAAYGPDLKKDSLQWEDNFNTLDHSRWEFIVTGNDDRNSYVENGTLHLRATLVNDEISDRVIRSIQNASDNGKVQGDEILPVYSAQIRTKDLISAKTGKVKVKAKFPMGDWLRAEISLLSGEMTEGHEPTFEEIKIADGCGNKQLLTADGRSMGANTVRHGVRWTSGDSTNSSFWETSLSEGYFSDDFHVFEVGWSSGHVVFHIDEKETAAFSIAPDDGNIIKDISEVLNSWFGASEDQNQKFYLSVKLSVGGSFFDEDFQNLNYPKPWNSSGEHPLIDFYENDVNYSSTWDRPELEIDYVRVYQH